jgi:hypothetical protein
MERVLPPTENQKMTRHVIQKIRNHQDTILTVLLIGTFLWIARFLLSAEMGFYEDDYTLVVRAMAGTWQEAFTFVRDLFINFGGQGRPLQHSVLFIVSRAIEAVGGLSIAHEAAFIILWINAVLFFILAMKISGKSLASLSSLFYVLFSADTTQPFLYHAYGLQQSITYLLLASISYLSGKRALSYLLILGSLLSYENSYWVFLAVPLINVPWQKANLKRVGAHVGIMVSMFIIVVAIRFATGEGRVSELGWSEIFRLPIKHMILGTLVAIGSNVLRPIQALFSFDPGVYLISIATLPIFILLVRRWILADEEKQTKISNRPAEFLERVSQESSKDSRYLAVKLLLIAILMIALAYPLTFTVRPYAISGRDSRVHFSAILGYALFWGSAWYSLFLWLKGRLRAAAVVVLALNFSFLIGFGILVQKDYVRAWTLQKIFWRSLTESIPHTTEPLTVFVDPKGLEDTQYIDANTWNLLETYQYIYSFQQNDNRGAQIYRLIPDWKEKLQVNSTEIKALNFRYQLVTSKWENTIIYETEDNRISNRLETIEIDGTGYSLHQSELVAPSEIPRGYLYSKLIE